MTRDKIRQAVPVSLVVIDNNRVSYPYSCFREGYLSFLKLRHGTYMYQTQQQEKPLNVADIFRQQLELS